MPIMTDALVTQPRRRKLSADTMVKQLHAQEWSIQRFPWGGWVYIGPQGEKRYDELPEWGSPLLDVYLRSLSRETSIFANVLSRQLRTLRGFGWQVKINEDPEDEKMAELACHYYHRMLLWCAGRRGWLVELAKTFADVRTLTRGGFLRFHRKDRYHPVHDIEALDALRCWPTGDEETPVLYWPPAADKPITLGWWECLHVTDTQLPITTPSALVKGLGYSALYDLRNDVLTELSFYRVLWQMSGRVGMERLALVYGMDVGELKMAIQHAREERDSIGPDGELPLVPGMAWIAAPEVFVPGGDNERPSLEMVSLAGWPDGLTWTDFQQHFAAVCEARMGEAVGTSYPLERGTQATTAARISEAKQTGTGATMLLEEVVRAVNTLVLEGKDAPELELDEMWSVEDADRAQIDGMKAGTAATIIKAENEARIGPTGEGAMMTDEQRRAVWQHFELHILGMFADDEEPEETFALRHDERIDFDQDIERFSEHCAELNKAITEEARRATTFLSSSKGSRRSTRAQAVDAALVGVQHAIDGLRSYEGHCGLPGAHGGSRPKEECNVLDRDGFDEQREHDALIIREGQAGSPKLGVTREQMQRYFARRDAVYAAMKHRYKDGTTAKQIIDKALADGLTNITQKGTAIILSNDDGSDALRFATKVEASYIDVMLNRGAFARNYDEFLESTQSERSYEGHCGLPDVHGGSRPKEECGLPEASAEEEAKRDRFGDFEPLELEELQDALAFDYCMDDRAGDELALAFVEKSGVYGAVGRNEWREADRHATIKLIDQTVAELARETGEPEEWVNKMLMWWAESSNETTRTAIIQRAVSEEFGVFLSGWQEENIGNIDVYSKPDYGSVRKLLRIMYERTQKRLEELDIHPDDHIILFRGGSIPKPQRGEAMLDMGDVVPYLGNAAESWSLGALSTQAFRSQHTLDSPRIGVIVAAKVPVRNILSTATTGMGCLREGEVVVLPGRASYVSILDAQTIEDMEQAEFYVSPEE